MAGPNRGLIMKVFVYGSLKKDQWNHGLLAHAHYLGGMCTEPHYQMLSMGAFPAVIEDFGNGIPIWGEVYDIDETTLDILDRLEGHPDFYHRVEIMTPWGVAWIYLLSEPHPSHAKCTISSGDWK